MYNELLKAGLNYRVLEKLSYHSHLDKSLVNSLRHFDKKLIFDDIQQMIKFYNNSEELDDLAIDYRIKSKDSCLRKYNKFYPEMRNDDGYRGVHVYYQLDHHHYPIEIQMNTYYDRQINNWLHKYLYKKNYPNEVGLKLRQLYEDGKILNESMFREVLKDVLSDCKGI